MDFPDFSELLKSLPENVIIEPVAEKDLAKLLKKSLREFGQIFRDIVRLGKGELPPAGRKKLKTMPAWQFDAGRFRVVYALQADKIHIIAVLPKSEQKKRFRGMR